MRDDHVRIMSNIGPLPNGLRSFRGEYANAVFIAAALIPLLFAAAVLWILPVGGLSVDRGAMAARARSLCRAGERPCSPRQDCRPCGELPR